MKTISEDVKGESLTGKQIGKLMKKENIFDDKKFMLCAVEFVQKDVEKALTHLENFKADVNFMSWKERYEKADMLCD